MICATCTAAKRPARGSPSPWYCDACGWALPTTIVNGRETVAPGTDRTRPTSEAALLVAQVELTREYNTGQAPVPGTREALDAAIVRAVKTIGER